VQAPQPQTAPVTAQPVSGAFPWLWLLAALVVAGAAAAFMLRRRRSLEDEDVRDRGALAGSLAAAPEPEPEPEPDIAPPAPEPVPEPAKRPWLDVDLRPERTEALEDGAFVHYALTLTNRGDAPAGNIRIDGRMFNAGADGAVEAFFAAPLHPVSGSPHVAIPPGEAITLHGQVGMPRAEMQAIDVQGRAIFVPLVAVNVGYDWDGGAGGKTSRSWLVGREASTPEARMGAFRLDLGPRIYRQVDRREAKKALA
jgi:hypothetical protein